MVILGLGSNLGDRLAHLRLALELIKQIPSCSVQQISPVYISDALLPENAPAHWDIPYLNLALRCHTELLPYEFLEWIKKIEIKIGRTPEKNWGPRIIDIDILAWDILIQYDEKLHIPHEYLAERPFALWPLADVAPHWVHPLHHKTSAEMVLNWGSRFSGDAPFHTRQIQQRIDTPQLVGILNMTPDSFSDGGQFMDPTLALQHVKKLVKAGAEIIDIGAEATGPQGDIVNPLTEWQRLEPILTVLLPELDGMHIRPKISIDTRHAITAKKCLDLKVDWINDVSGLTSPEMREIIADYTNDVVIMHHLTIPEDRTLHLPRHEDVSVLVYQWAIKQLERLEKDNINAERIIFDIGVGFGKTAEQSLALIKSIPLFQQLKTRLLVGHSRKSFLQLFTAKPAPERDIETIVLSLSLMTHAIDYLRVHNISDHAHAFKVAAVL